ncbi:hypothetical protein CXF72_13480 [Psychromonas sp. MB-3u-54]|nr:hypothetical protein CXF72_13480 [Psychromonas sp. MB-3u-54]
MVLYRGLIKTSQGLIACSSNYEIYADLSHKMMQVIGRFGPSLYISSIDESFLNCNEAIPDLVLHAQKIKNPPGSMKRNPFVLVKHLLWQKWLIRLQKNGLSLMAATICSTEKRFTFIMLPT